MKLNFKSEMMGKKCCLDIFWTIVLIVWQVFLFAKNGSELESVRRWALPKAQPEGTSNERFCSAIMGLILYRLVSSPGPQPFDFLKSLSSPPSRATEPFPPSMRPAVLRSLFSAQFLTLILSQLDFFFLVYVKVPVLSSIGVPQSSILSSDVTFLVQHPQAFLWL